MLLFYPPIVVHDWVVTIGEWQFGIREFDWRGSETTIYAGQTSFATQLSPYAVLSIVIVGSLVVTGVLAFLIARSCRKRDGTNGQL
jgi:hypothetical protein